MSLLKLNFCKIEFCKEFNFLILEFHVFCAMVEVADVAFLIKRGHVELNFTRIEFCTFKKKYNLLFVESSSLEKIYYMHSPAKLGGPLLL